jgi:hypothetical protein
LTSLIPHKTYYILINNAEPGYPKDWSIHEFDHLDNAMKFYMENIGKSPRMAQGLTPVFVGRDLVGNTAKVRV